MNNQIIFSVFLLIYTPAHVRTIAITIYNPYEFNVSSKKNCLKIIQNIFGKKKNTSLISVPGKNQFKPIPINGSPKKINAKTIRNPTILSNSTNHSFL